MICDQKYTIPKSGWGEPDTAINVRAIVETGRYRRFSVRAYRPIGMASENLDIFDTDEQVIQAARYAHRALGEILRNLEQETK